MTRFNLAARRVAASCRNGESGAVPREPRRERGSAAIELVLVLPLALMLLLGFMDIYNYMRTQSTLEQTAFMLADSLSQMPNAFNDTSTANANTLGSIWYAANLIAKPLALSTNGGVIITSVCDSLTSPCTGVNATKYSMVAGVPKIWWQASAPWNTSKAVTKETSTSILPTYFPFRTGDGVMVVEVFYVYDPFTLVRGFLPNSAGKTTLYKRVYVQPRTGSALALLDKSLE